MLGTSLRHGVDTTVSPCTDFYAYVNGDWRAKATPPKNVAAKSARDRNFFDDTYVRTERRLQRLLDSARAVAATTDDATIRVLGVYYESCLVAPELEQTRARPSQSARDSTKTMRDSIRARQCVQRAIQNFGSAIGQAFAQDLFASHALSRMESLLEAIHKAVIIQLQQNPWFTDAEKTLALDRLSKLRLRVGMPRERTDYQSLVLSPTDYHGNKTTIANFQNQAWVTTIGGDTREKWKRSLLEPNAFYVPFDHAIEIPAVMFMPPFFDVDYDDALNFGAIGIVVGHEVFHSIAKQLETAEDPAVKVRMDRLKAMYTTMPTIEKWEPNGERTFNEDIADVGGIRVAYNAWQAVVAASTTKSAPVIDGYTSDQRFFIAAARVWRGTWATAGARRNGDIHSPYFARVNGMMMSMPEFAKAFGCKEGDPMVLPDSKRAQIW